MTFPPAIALAPKPVDFPFFVDLEGNGILQIDSIEPGVDSCLQHSSVGLRSSSLVLQIILYKNSTGGQIHILGTSRRWCVFVLANDGRELDGSKYHYCAMP